MNSWIIIDFRNDFNSDTEKPKEGPSIIIRKKDGSSKSRLLNKTNDFVDGRILVKKNIASARVEENPQMALNKLRINNFLIESRSNENLYASNPGLTVYGTQSLKPQTNKPNSNSKHFVLQSKTIFTWNNVSGQPIKNSLAVTRPGFHTNSYSEIMNSFNPVNSAPPK